MLSAPTHMPAMSMVSFGSGFGDPDMKSICPMHAIRQAVGEDFDCVSICVNAATAASSAAAFAAMSA